VWDVDRLDLPAYLERVGTTETATLAELHRAHVAAIPFENLDIRLGRGIAVDLESVQAKLVARRRGGYCYEHGILFAAVLERLGYGVQRLLARVGGYTEQPRGRTHMALLVDAGGERLLADVGFGGGLLDPLPFAPGVERRQGAWTFRLREAGAGGSAFEVQERRPDGWATLYGFADERQYPADVVVANHFTSTFPRSPFVTRVVVSRRDEQTLRELVDRTLTVTGRDYAVEERSVDLAEALPQLGLELSREELEVLEDVQV
jgi:N-hydroxyarylamine O-acetyltransferase